MGKCAAFGGELPLSLQNRAKRDRTSVPGRMPKMPTNTNESQEPTSGRRMDCEELLRVAEKFLKRKATVGELRRVVNHMKGEENE
jgi:hypothetical protein